MLNKGDSHAESRLLKTCDMKTYRLKFSRKREEGKSKPTKMASTTADANDNTGTGKAKRKYVVFVDIYVIYL